MDWSNVPDNKKKLLYNKVGGSMVVMTRYLVHSESNRFLSTQGSQSFNGIKTIGRQRNQQKGQPVGGGRTHTPVGMRAPLQSTLTTPPTPRRGTRRHRVVDGILYHSL